MWPVDPPQLEFHLVEPQCAVQSLPQVAILHRNHLAVVFPLPAVAPPFIQAILHALSNVRATANQCDFRRLIEGLKGAYDRQQIEPITSDLGLDVGRLEPFVAVGRLQRESPLT